MTYRSLRFGIGVLANALALAGAALAVGLSAHLLVTGAGHHGSERDFVVLGLDLILTALLSRHLTPRAATVAALAVASASLGVGWLFVEHPAHVPFAEMLATLAALVPMLCVLVSALLFAAASAHVSRAVAAALRVRRATVALRPRCAFDGYGRGPKRTRDIRLRARQRRGPPIMLLAPIRSI